MHPKPEIATHHARRSLGEGAAAAHPIAVELGAVMAQLMAANGEAVTREQLLDRGFDAAELAAHGEFARAYAARLIEAASPPYAAWWPDPKITDPARRRARVRERRLAARITGDAA